MAVTMYYYNKYIYYIYVHYTNLNCYSHNHDNADLYCALVLFNCMREIIMRTDDLL